MKPILTICYFSYNDSTYWAPVVQELLLLKEDRFRIVVQDNASTDNSDQIASQINDPRFIYRKNPNNLGSSLNIIAALSDNKSVYCLLMMARDRILGMTLLKFIDFLENQNPDYGNCSLWGEKKDYTFCNYASGVSSLLQSYNSRHPSGYFWKTEILNQTLQNINFNKYSTFDFIYELINGPIGCDYAFTHVNYPLIETFDARKDVPDRKSYFTVENNFKHAPQRINTLNIFIYQVYNSSLNKKDKKYLSKKLINKYCEKVTYLYFLILKAGDKHYGLDPRKVTLSEMKKNLKLLITTLDKETSSYIDTDMQKEIISEALKFKRNFYYWFYYRIVKDKMIKEFKKFKIMISRMIILLHK